MNKKRIDDMIPKAFKALEESDIVSKDKKKIKKTYRGAVSTFGAAIVMGSPVAAACFFNNEGSSDLNRKELSKVIFEVMKSCDDSIKAETLYDYTTDKNSKCDKELIIDAAIAVKLAMNLFELEKE